MFKVILVSKSNIVQENMRENEIEPRLKIILGGREEHPLLCSPVTASSDKSVEPTLLKASE